MQGFLLFIHIFASILLIIIVLLQSGKSADLAGTFGGGGSQSAFGPRGVASFLSKLTTTLAVLFMVTSLLLYIMAANRGKSDSVFDKKGVKQEQKKESVEKKSETKKPTDKSTTTEKKETDSKKNIKDNKTEGSKKKE